MLSINMRIFKTVLLLLVAFYFDVHCSPVPSDLSTVELNSTDETTTYDQRQNGTQNYHVHLDGLLFLIAPAEDLVLPVAAAAAVGNKPTLSTILQEKPIADKPEPEPKGSSVAKSAHRAGVRLTDLLLPFMRHFRHQ